jgi:DNA polymerase-4
MKIHLDLDSFFVSAHRTIDKSLLNKPVVVVKRNDKEIFKNPKAKNF